MSFETHDDDREGSNMSVTDEGRPANLPTAQEIRDILRGRQERLEIGVRDTGIEPSPMPEVSAARMELIKDEIGKLTPEEIDDIYTSMTTGAWESQIREAISSEVSCLEALPEQSDSASMLAQFLRQIDATLDDTDL